MQLETPGGRGYSTQFTDHEGLIHKFARKGFARLQAANVDWVDYDEVFGQMQLYFVQATKHYDPKRGYTFTAYCGQVCFYNFNKWASALIEGQIAINPIRIGDLSPEHSDGGKADFYEIMSGEDESPEDIIERLDYVHKTRCNLSGDTKLVVRELAAPSQDLQLAMRDAGRDEASIAFIGRFLNMSPARIKRVKQELSEKFHVDL